MIKGQVVSIFATMKPGVFCDTQSIKKYLCRSSKGMLKIVRLRHRSYRADYIGVVDADGEVKQSDYNALATIIAGVPVYGNMVIFRKGKGKAFTGLLPLDREYILKITNELINIEEMA